ncbi:unnamed protein product, partial [Hymenolepis diminuta]
GVKKQLPFFPLGGIFDPSGDHAGSETSRTGTTLGLNDSIECVRLVTFTLSLTDGSNFRLSMVTLTGVAVENTLGDTGALGE